MVLHKVVVRDTTEGTLPLLRQINRKPGCGQSRQGWSRELLVQQGSLTLYNGHGVVISYVIVILTYSYSNILLTFLSFDTVKEN